MKYAPVMARIFNVLLRVVGVFWVLAGLVGILDSVLDARERWGGLLISIVFFVAGIALIVAKRAKPED